jgi:hypothetical protein
MILRELVLNDSRARWRMQQRLDELTISQARWPSVECVWSEGNTAKVASPFSGSSWSTGRRHRRLLFDVVRLRC